MLCSSGGTLCWSAGPVFAEFVQRVTLYVPRADVAVLALPFTYHVHHVFYSGHA